MIIETTNYTFEFREKMTVRDNLTIGLPPIWLTPDFDMTKISQEQMLELYAFQVKMLNALLVSPKIDLLDLEMEDFTEILNAPEFLAMMTKMGEVREKKKASNP